MLNNNKNKGMSFEAVLDEERRDVLDLLQKTAKEKAAAKAARSSSPFATQRSPIRSMLDIGDAPSANRRISASSGSSVPTRQPVRSMLDISSPPPGSPPPVRSMLDVGSNSNGEGNGTSRATAPSKSAQTSPTETHHRTRTANGTHPRSLSDAASRPSGFGPRSTVEKKEDSYQFSGFLPTNLGAVMPKRTQGGKKNSLPSAMSEVIRGGDLSLFGSRDRGRHSIASTGIGSSNAKSKSPSNRFNIRSSSPALGSDSDLVLDNGTHIDSNNAYRKLSDKNLAFAKGGLSALADRGHSKRTGSKSSVGPSGYRLQKGEEYSSDDNGDSSDDGRRGRKNSGSKSEASTLGMGRAEGPRTAQSLMAAAEEERESSSSSNSKPSLIIT